MDPNALLSIKLCTQFFLYINSFAMNGYLFLYFRQMFSILDPTFSLEVYFPLEILSFNVFPPGQSLQRIRFSCRVCPVYVFFVSCGQRQRQIYVEKALWQRLHNVPNKHCFLVHRHKRNLRERVKVVCFRAGQKYHFLLVFPAEKYIII